MGGVMRKALVHSIDATFFDLAIAFEERSRLAGRDRHWPHLARPSRSGELMYGFEA
jgi:hypothetical protein